MSPSSNHNVERYLMYLKMLDENPRIILASFMDLIGVNMELINVSRCDTLE